MKFLAPPSFYIKVTGIRSHKKFTSYRTVEAATYDEAVNILRDEFRGRAKLLNFERIDGPNHPDS